MITRLQQLLFGGARAGRVGAAQLLAALLLGVAAGLVAGYVLMGTAHAIMEIGADSHYKHSDG